MILHALALLAIVIGYVVHTFTKILPCNQEQYQTVEKIPGPPIENKVLGHPSMAFLKPEVLPRAIYQQYKEFGGIFRHWYGWIPSVIIAEADYAKIFFTSKSLKDKANSYKIVLDWMGHGLITSNGALWHERRKMLTPAFHLSVLNMLHEILVQNSIVMIRKLRERSEDAPMDVYQAMHLMALENICEAAMGVKIDALDNPQIDYVQAIENVQHATLKRIGEPWFWNSLFYYSATGQQVTKSLDKIFELAHKAILKNKNKRARQVEDEENGNDEVKGTTKPAFLDILLEAHESPTKALSEQDLRDEVNTFIFAGHDTTATSMSFSLFLLGMHPDIQEKCYQELDDIFRGSDRAPTVDDLKSMKYLEQCIKESLRLFPSIPFILRNCQEDVQFGNYTVPDGATVGLSIFCMHRDPKYFPNPEIFDPERFNSENCVGRHSFAYVPFAAGSRNCIGQKFAMMEQKVVISYILRNFIIESLYGMDEIELSFDVVMRPKKPLDVRLKPRVQKITK
ncbi:cytochrome P450 4C1-like [Bemisia tabaci]